MSKHDSYEDWFDNGPGSEKFKREIRESELEFLKKRMFFPLSPLSKKIKHKKNGKNVCEMLDAIDRRLKENNEEIPKGLLEETVKIGRRLLRYVGELES
jgi:hypothetical protein